MEDKNLIPGKPNAVEITALRKVAETAKSETLKNKLLRLIAHMCDDMTNLVSGYTLKNEIRVCMNDIEFLNKGLESRGCQVRVKRNWSDDEFEHDDFCLARIHA